MYIIGIDYGHGETSAAVLEIANELYDKMASFEKEDYSNPDTEPISLAEKITAIGMSMVAVVQNPPLAALQHSSLEGGDNQEDVSSDAGGEWNVTTIRNLLYKSFYTLKDLKIKGDAKTIKSVMAYDWKKGRWEIGPNIQKLKQCISNLDYENNQYAKMAAYFKAPLVSGKGKDNGSNNLEAIKPENKLSFGLFIESVFKSIIESNTIIHENPCNYRLYVACPSEWDKDQIDEYIKFLHERGVHCEEVVQESRAAYMAFRDTIIGNTINDKELPGVLVIDFGSSTIDFTYFGGEKTVNHGCQKGAHKVEEIIFDYLCDNEPTAKNAFDKLKEALNGDELLAKTLLVFATRNMKEQFFTDLADNEDATFEDTLLKNLVIPGKDTGVIFTAADAFGFDYGGGCDWEKMKKILSGYIEDVKSAFLDFIKIDGVGSINHVILTGGASKMQFVKELTEDVFNVHKYSSEEINNGKKVTLHIDDEPSYSISRGIAKYGTYRTLSEPIRKAIDDRLTATWRNEKWLNNELKSLTYSVTSEVYYSYFCSIVNEWKKVDSPIKSEENNNLNALLEDIYDKILQEDPNNLLWKNIKLAKDMFEPGQRSIHALLRKLYDDIELNDEENRNKIDNLMIDELTKKINLQVGSLFKKYLSIYFDDYDGRINPDLPKFYNIKIEFSEDQKEALLIKLIENICSKMDSTSTQTARTFNLNRNADSSILLNATRKSLSPVIKEVLKSFCDEIRPDFNINAISKSCKESVNKKYEEIKKICEQEPYKLKV
jgi:cell division ATPase FtsA